MHNHNQFYFWIGFSTALVLILPFYCFFIKRKLQYFKYIDKQTKLFNYDYLLKTLCLDIEESFIIIADIDNFKNYNTLYGYKRGDEIILIVKDILAKYVSMYNGLLFRYRSGDEFVMMLYKKYIRSDELAIFFKSINETFTKEITNNNGTLSFGITVKESKLTVEDIFKRLESALLKAKEFKGSVYYISVDSEDWIFNSNHENEI